MDMGSVGIPPNDRGAELLSPLPFAASPDLLFQGSAAREEAEPGSPAWLQLRYKTPGGWSDRAVTLQGLLSGMRNSTLRKPLPLKGPTQSRQRSGERGFYTGGSQIPS